MYGDKKGEVVFWFLGVKWLNTLVVPNHKFKTLKDMTTPIPDPTAVKRPML